MVNEYLIKNKITALDFLKQKKLSKANIYKLFQLQALSTTKIIKENDILENETLYINFSLLETNETQTPVQGKINIIYEDDNFIALDKDCNTLIHSDGNTFDTLLNYIVFYLQEKYDDSYVRPLHRIDYETSGVILFSKNILAHAYVSNLLETNNVFKKYQALVLGHFPKENKKVILNIGKDRHNSKKYIVSNTGKESITSVQLAEYSNNYSLLDIIISTGRPHQIRVTLEYLGYPIINDSLYNKNYQNGNLKLLSKELKFKFENKTIDILSNKDVRNI